MVQRIVSAGTLIECKGKILILLRNYPLTQGNTWGLPAGKNKPGESSLQTAVREVFEETGYKANPELFEYVRNFDWHFPDIEIIFPTYLLRISKQFDVKLNPDEHSEYKWLTPQDVYHLPNLIHGFKDLLEKLYNCK